MKWPPRNADAALAKRRREKLTGLPEVYRAPGLVQSGIIWKRWCREAQRLFAQYWKTGNPRHLHALSRHIDAMRVHGRGQS